MKPAAFDYVAPTTVDEALDHLERSAGEATILAGGQTLMPLLSLRLSNPSLLIDINRIAALRGIAQGDGGIRIGAITRQNEVATSSAMAAALPVVVEAVRHMGHHQTRSRGTVGGSVSLGEPAAELPATAVALGASIEASSKRGTRLIAAEEFYIGPYATALEPDELVTAIRFPHWPSDSITIFREVARRPGDFALVGLVGAVTLERGRINRVGLAWFGMGPTPIRARQAEREILGQSVSDIDFNSVGELAVADTQPFDDHAATSHYRRTVGRRIFIRTLSEALTMGQNT